MKQFCRLLACNVLLAGMLTGCSTPGIRAHGHAAALHRLSPADQQLVLRGHIHPGMDQEAVDIAWGSSDAKTSGGGKSESETWVYRQRVTLYEPMNSYYFSGPYHGYATEGIGRGFLPDYAYGGAGYEGALRYQPHVRFLDSVRIAEFSGGNVDRFKTADGIWQRASPPVVENNHAAMAALIAKPVDRRWQHVAHFHSQSVAPRGETRFGERHRRNSTTLRLAAVGTRQLHHVKEPGGRKTVSVRTAPAVGSKAGVGQQGSDGSGSGYGVHALGACRASCAWQVENPGRVTLVSTPGIAGRSISKIS